MNHWWTIICGVTGFLANFRWAGHDLELGAGAEVSIDTAIHDGGRLGVRFGAESLTNSRALLALGGRYYVRDTVWFGVDGFLRLPEATDSSGRSWGLMVGVGATGRAGVIAGLADLSLGATLAFIAVILGAGGH